MKNYIGFINDHSGSMHKLAKSAIVDYNANIKAVCEAASSEMLDTVVSVIGIGVPTNNATERQVVISNPHVLKPVTRWPTSGLTPLYDGIADMISLFESLPDYNSPDVSFLVFVTTDGEEYGSRHWDKYKISQRIAKLQQSGRWTFVFRIPKGYRHHLNGLGIPTDNIYEWDTTEKGMEAATVATQSAMRSYYTQRASGSKSSTVFYADASAVDVSKLKDISSEVVLYVVPDTTEIRVNGIEIRDFVLTKRMQYLKGSAFYQLTKTEAKISPKKLILIRDRTTGKVYGGNDARTMIGLSTTNNARLHPGDHGNYDIFIQSESVNRKLVAGTGLLYWEAIGKPFADDDPVLQYGKPKKDDNGVVQLPKVVNTGKPTPSPIPKAKSNSAPTFNGRPVMLFDTRDGGRAVAKQLGKPIQDIRKYGLTDINGQRWFCFL